MMKPPNVPDTCKLCHMRSIWGYTPEALYVLQSSLTQDWLRSIISTACFSISHPLQVALKGVNACCSKDFILPTYCSLMVVGFVNNTKTCLACKAGDASQMQMATFLMLWSHSTLPKKSLSSKISSKTECQKLSATVCQSRRNLTGGSACCDCKDTCCHFQICCSFDSFFGLLAEGSHTELNPEILLI